MSAHTSSRQPDVGAVRLLSRTFFHRGRVFETSHDAIQLASGVRLELDVIHHLGGAAVLPIFDNDDVLLIRQYRHPAGQVLLEAPAGRLELGEVPEAAARRELLEETGYQAETFTFVTKFYALPGYSTEVLYCFSATGLTPGAQCLDADEDIRTVRLPLAEALSLVHRGGIVDAKTMMTLLLVDAQRRESAFSAEQRRTATSPLPDCLPGPGDGRGGS
ncbi:NUDIX hydrolase [Chloracidobacterium validum]|uniref:GDP-mannose pyrophosphatase n=1 Tax=Chloracidobacterium validum TaxID=2821543 RepID=A0ABX8B606_9BACT|nr:NUDIX hydrolase [Chloracidobacterium validum]QUW02056.1 NUDIX hydrolase [Chloracidobacterium validum]